MRVRPAAPAWLPTALRAPLQPSHTWPPLHTPPQLLSSRRGGRHQGEVGSAHGVLSPPPLCAEAHNPWPRAPPSFWSWPRATCLHTASPACPGLVHPHTRPSSPVLCPQLHTLTPVLASRPSGVNRGPGGPRGRECSQVGAGCRGVGGVARGRGLGPEPGPRL